jgi:hypothetical protein
MGIRIIVLVAVASFLSKNRRGGSRREFEMRYYSSEKDSAEE